MKSAVVAYLLWCLVCFGFAGIHRFYAGKWVSGLIWLFTGGLFLFGQAIDLILIPGMIHETNLRANSVCRATRRLDCYRTFHAFLLRVNGLACVFANNLFFPGFSKNLLVEYRRHLIILVMCAERVYSP